jgi:hypothetical protein
MPERTTGGEIALRRLRSQYLTTPTFARPDEVVAWLGAAWALGLRMRAATEAAIDAALADGSILRTHIMRPTWHFVTPADIRWLLALSGPRLRGGSASRQRELGLDAGHFTRGIALMVKALEGGQHLTRPELIAVLEQAGMDISDPGRFVHIMGRAEADGIICSGARRGKQQTYALLDERVPPAPPLPRDAALAELTRRYFTSHGPATVADFVWWSGLTLGDARAGLAGAGSQLERETIDGQTYWFEYLVAYRDRSAAIGPIPAEKLDARANILFNHTIVLDGRVAGSWRRGNQKAAVVVEVTPFRPLTPTETDALTTATARYGAFLELPATLSVLAT